MCRSRSLLFSVAVLLTLAMLCGMPAFPQDPPSIAMGLNPQATYHGGDFDFVDMATGRLNLYIPLVEDHSQRGKLNFTYSLTYSSTGSWGDVQRTPPSGGFFIQPPKYGVSSPAFENDGFLSAPSRSCFNDPSINYQACAYFVYDGGYGIGGSHVLGSTSGNASLGTFESIDGSAISATIQNVCPGNIYTVRSRTGVIFEYTCSNSYIEDANGNELTSAGSYPAWTTTDTLGRLWTTTQNSSDVSGCPTGGPVAPNGSTIWTIPGINNGVRTFKFCYSAYNIQTSFHISGLNEYSGSQSFLTGVVLPDGTTWRFDYDNYSYGDLVAVYPPTGGYISYSWTTVTDPSVVSGDALRTVASRTTFDGANSNTWRYNWQFGSPTAYTVTDPLGNDTVHTGNPVSQIKYYAGSAGTGTLIKTTTKAFRMLPDPYACDFEAAAGSNCAPRPLLQSTTTAWPNGQQSQVASTYDSAFSFTDLSGGTNQLTTYTSSYGLVTSESHSDYGNGAPGGVLSTTNTNYVALSNSSYATANILELPSSVISLSGNGSKCSETDYGYDASSQIVSSGVSKQHLSAPTPGVLGNLTSITRQLFGNPCQSANPSSTPLTTNRYVYDTGMLQKSVDPRLNPTTYSYSSTYYGAYPTTITNALNQPTGFGYDFNTGFLTSTTDPNQQPTQYAPDCMLRPLSITYPDGGQEAVTYNYSGGAGCSGAHGLTYTGATQTKKINASLTLSKNSIFDGLGRLTHTQLTSDPEGTDYTDTTYDADGRVYSVSNPYRSTSDSTYGLTKYQYDPLNRVTTVIEPDLSAVSTSYSGGCTTVFDEALHSRGSCTDGLQRLTEVDDHSAPTAAPTSASGSTTVNGSEKSHFNAGSSGSLGPKAPASGTDDASIGTFGWGNPNNVTAYDGAVALAGASVPASGSVESHYLDAKTYFSSVPSNSTINGIIVTIYRRAASNDVNSITASDSSVRLIKGGVISGNDHADIFDTWPITTTAMSYGSSTDLWGLSLTPADLNSSNFGVAVSASICNNDVGSHTSNVSIDYISMTVYYTVPSSTTYDSGTVSVTVNGVQMSATYGQGDTAGSVASRLASNINGNGSSPVTASLPSGSTTITLTAKTTGSATNYSLTPGSSSNNPGLFSPPSFSVSGSSLSGGYDAGGALTASTFYQYDAINNLIRVDQKNGDSNSADWRTRLFAYDSLSRLQQATNPESGTICYGTYAGSTCQLNGYDPNGNLIYKTDARGITTTFAYDAFNRLTQKSYSDGLTATAKYGYDAVAPTGCSPSLTMAYPIGRRTAMCDAAGNVSGIEAWSYDKMGRAVTDQRSVVVNGVTKTITTNYGYNFDGSIASIIYPTGRTITYTPSAAGRTLSAVDTTNGINYATSALYTPGGALRSLTNGTARVSNYFNSRLQPCRFAVNTSGTAPSTCGDSNKGNVTDFTYNFGLGADNGNVLGITNNITAGRSLTAAYDALNRIESSYTGTWSEQYGMDLWGNLTSITAMSGKPAGENLSQSATTQNRFAGMSYDAAGNLLNDGSTGYAFDAESRISTAGAMSYGYDGDGKRVVKATSGVPNRIYSYGLGSAPIDETDGTGSITNSNFSEYIFFNGKRIARRDGSGNVFYYFTDHLGSSREIVQAGQTLPCYDADFYPFGRESTVYTNTCPQNYKFTGKERDETSLDNFGARYYTSQYVRFMTPDWAANATAVPYADLGNPQSLNLYGYVKNNPLSYADPDGHCDWCNDAFDFSFGVVRGAASSISFGTTGSPQSTDTDASRLGQIVGSGLVGAAGEITSDAGKGAVALGLAGELPSAGTSTSLVVVGAGATAVGTAAEAGAAANLAKLVGAPMQAGFSQKAKDAARANAGGKCEYCGKETVPGQKSQKGVTPPGNEGQTDHYDPVSKGGSNDPSNAAHACRDCNQVKSNTSPRDTRWQLPRKKDDNN
jgi:RHS repeat-associated protein